MTHQDTPNGDIVALWIPCRAEYVGVARLAVLGVAGRLDFSYDEVEDLRLAVGEACTGAIQRASRVRGETPRVCIECRIESDRVVITIRDSIPNSEHDLHDGLGASLNHAGISSLLMDVLVDDATVELDPEGGTMVTLTKIARHHRDVAE